MKYRLLGKNGPQVSAISMGRGAQPIRFGDPLEQDLIVLTAAEREHLSEVFAIGAGAGNRYHDVVLQGVAL